MIKTLDLCFSYPGSEKVRILNNVNLNFQKDYFYVILGPNGCGKTTLIKILARLLKPTSGKLFLNEIAYDQIKVKDFYKLVSYVPQKFFSIYPYTVFEIVLMGRSLHLNLLGYESTTDIIKVEEVLDELNISHLARKRINEISGGELQKVIIARSLVQETDILLLDEPNTHLDIKHQIQIFEILRNLTSKGKTIIAVSHDVNLASFYSDRLIFMKDGTIKYEGDQNSVLKEEVIKEIFEVENKVMFDPVEKIPQLIIKPLGRKI